jgi:hypothetical protein
VNDSTTTKTRKPRTVEPKPYVIERDGELIGYAIAKTAALAASLLAPAPLTARPLTAAEAAQVDPAEFVTAETPEVPADV